MRITLCVDALEPQLTGVGRYTWELCKGLAKRDDVELRYFARNRLIKSPESLVLGNKLPQRGSGFRRLSSYFDRRKIRQSLIHGPNYFLPTFAEQGVITVHDLSVFRYPETHPVERVRAFQLEFERSLRRATQIITDTETVRRELIDDFDIPEEKVNAIHLGVDSRFRPQQPAAIRQALAPLKLKPHRYALCVSTLEPRKKIDELLAAWQRLPRAMRSDFQLVLAGGAGWLNEGLRAAIELGVAEGWLRYLGFVDEATLPSLYAGASLFIYPSSYEGFGLPPLEAMASGVPVLVSSHSCLPEVCGNSAGYFDPGDPDEMQARISQGLTDQAWQAEFSRRGIERAAQFDWGRCVEATVQVYRKAIALI